MKKIYIMNLKNVYNISRNKANMYGGSFSQTDNFSLTKNNGKITYDKNKNKIVNHTYSSLFSNDKQDILTSKKNKILIKAEIKKIQRKKQKILLKSQKKILK